MKLSSVFSSWLGPEDPPCFSYFNSCVRVSLYTNSSHSCHFVFDPRPVPDICSAIMSFLLRFPHAVECLESCRSLMHDHYLTPPKLSMPTLPPELTQLKEELSQLPTQARHCCMSIISRFRRLNSNSQHPEQP